MRFNASKCKCMHLGKQNPQQEYQMNDINTVTGISSTNQEKYLGVLFDNELKFSERIAKKVKKANQMLAMICRTFTCLEKEIFMPLHKSFFGLSWNMLIFLSNSEQPWRVFRCTSERLEMHPSSIYSTEFK